MWLVRFTLPPRSGLLAMRVGVGCRGALTIVSGRSRGLGSRLAVRKDRLAPNAFAPHCFTAVLSERQLPSGLGKRVEQGRGMGDHQDLGAFGLGRLLAGSSLFINILSLGVGDSDTGVIDGPSEV